MNNTFRIARALAGVAVLITSHGMAQVDCLGVLGGPDMPGASCDDNNSLTHDDIWFPGCFCMGICDPVAPPQMCDDGNPNTGPDLMTVCGCMGECGGAGPCDDLNPWTSNDQWWQPPYCGCGGICDWPAGTLCDDGDPLTTGEFLNSNCQCIGGSNMISGQVFLDLDQNGTFGGSDVPLPNRWIHVGPGARYVKSGDQGMFSIVVPSGSYTLSVFPGTFDVQAQAPPVVPLIGQGLISSGHALAMNATSMATDLAAYCCTGMPVPGLIHSFYVFCRNEGTQPATGTASLTYDPLMIFVSSDPGATIQGTTATWNVPVLQPGEQFYKRVVLMTPVGTPFGTVLQYSVQVTPVPPDADPSNDIRFFQPIVWSAFDPNDKQVSPSSLTTTDLANGQYVDYTINFQNTGNYPAQNIRITDQLPVGVMPSTFEFVGSSHPCAVTFQNGVLEFKFDNIMLPDSVNNEPDSHGFVIFRIKPYPYLQPGAVVWNRAYIYFDFNAPVVTNSAEFTIDNTTGIEASATTERPLLIAPNPANDQATLMLTGPLQRTGELIIHDATGRAVMRRDLPIGTLRFEFSTAALGSGVYSFSACTASEAIGQGKLSIVR